MFGRDPRLPIDTVFGLESTGDQKSTTKYVEHMKQRLKKSYELAAASVKNAQNRQKKEYDIKVRGAMLHPGDRVLVKILKFDGKHKLSDRWEDDSYVIVEQPNIEIPVFVVKKENGEGKKRTLHRNLLLPIGSIITDEEKERTKPTPKPRLRPRIQDKPETTPTVTVEADNSVSIDTETDSEDEPVVFVFNRTPEDTDDGTPHSTDEVSGPQDADVMVHDATDDD